MAYIYRSALFFFFLFATQLMFSSLLAILYVFAFNFLMILNVTKPFPSFWTGGEKNKEGENNLTGAILEQKSLNSTQGEHTHVTWGDQAKRWLGICLDGEQMIALPAWIQASWEGTETGSLDLWWC